MEHIEELIRPTKEEQKVALESYNALSATLEAIKSTNPEIEIDETEEKIKIPLKALKLLATILKATSQGKPISIVPIAMEITTQAAAEILGCSRPHLISMLENGEIPFTKVGKHRRIKYEDIIRYKKQIYTQQRNRLIDLMQKDEDLGLYDS